MNILRRMNMKKGSLILRLLAAALVACLIISAFAACGSAKTLMSVTKDGKTYTISTDEFSLLMKIKKLDICCSMLVTRSRDTASYWATTTDDGETYEEYYKNLILEQTKSILVEKYLFDVNGLSISSDKLAGYKSNIKTQNTYYGGKGAYKQYFGYTAADYYNIYMMMVARSEAVVDFLFGENGSQKLTAEDLETYYKENYVGYQFIMLDMENKVKLDEEGNRIIAKEEDSEGNEVDSDSYETEALTDEEKETKQTLVQAILDELAEGASFEDMIAKYSDAYYSVEFPEGMFVLKDGTFLSTTITEKIKDLEIGEYTEEAIESNKCQYIVKRVELKDKVYEDEKYLELFEEYEDTVKYDKYENYIETFFDDITVDEAVAAEYTVADTYLSKYADLYYQQWWSSYLSSSS
jgi:PPIC-type PPIASE domain protein